MCQPRYHVGPCTVAGACQEKFSPKVIQALILIISNTVVVTQAVISPSLRIASSRHRQDTFQNTPSAAQLLPIISHFYRHYGSSRAREQPLYSGFRANLKVEKSK